MRHPRAFPQGSEWDHGRWTFRPPEYVGGGKTGARF